MANNDLSNAQGVEMPPSSDGAKLADLLNEISARLVVPTADAGSGIVPATSDSSDYVQMMVFRLGDQSYGLDILVINEVLRSPNLTRVPGLPGWVLGVTNFHGEIISVIQLAEFLGISRTRPAAEQVVMVAHAEDQRIGLVVDDVENIYTTPVDQIVSPSFRIDSAIVPYLSGAVERNGEFIRLLHGERLLLGPQMQQFS